MLMAADSPVPAGADEFRWQGFFQRCQEPVFLLNGRRTILFVNRAWEALTEMPLAEARGLVCRRRREPRPDSPEILQHALAPPPEALAGKIVCVRRLLFGGPAGPRWWDVTFFPFKGPQGLLGMLGRIVPVAAEQTAGTPLLPERLVALRQRFRQGYSLESLDSQLPAMRRVAEQVRLACQTRSPVLVLGEPGTGKEWIARTLHQESADREKAFAALDCGKLPASALEAVLFGSLLLSRAGVGVVYLKDPQDMPGELQARVADLLTTSGLEAGGSIAPRLIAGCCGDAPADARASRLLPDLHYALSPLTIHVPPLRERLAELPLLVERMFTRLAEGDQPVKGPSAEALDVLRGHLWPGNLQELHSVLAQACQQARGERIEVGDLPWYLRNPAPPPERNLPLDTLLEQVERRLILLALQKARNNKTRAAETLAIWRPRLLRRMEALGIETEKEESDLGESE
jgi:DNA-binding NtrC family response regulator